MRFCLPAGHVLRVVLLTSFLPPMAAAQSLVAPDTPAPQPSLPDILLRLQENMWDYLSSVPNFFCDERVVSTMKQPDTRETKTTSESVFRLVRSKTIGEAPSFSETREVRTVNRHAAKGDEIHGPAIFSGAFSTASGVVSLEMARCFNYILEPMGQLNKAPAIVIDYTINPDVLHDNSCPGPEKQSGRAWIDPTSFRPLRVEMVIPNHIDNNGRPTLWTWAVDYAPVVFDSKQFWMPRTITSNAVSNDAFAEWSFTASYSNYHKLTVSSHIITDIDDKK
ncbi:hypothetical protein [Edaphobacter modestus]|uniref:Uncharacterized protein n=1 Tax=Edaphobacter modestus TaxID=388466 RepID=A0A4Q7YWX9_9BACT|nr:hypothetical protein [Edaphobacter modestus]RZU41633.1 hypothetical protein BDD14_3159 [Edaphobacter modestus]